MRRLRRISFVAVYWLLERTAVGRAILVTEWGKGWNTARALNNPYA